MLKFSQKFFFYCTPHVKLNHQSAYGCSQAIISKNDDDGFWTQTQYTEQLFQLPTIFLSGNTEDSTNEWWGGGESAVPFRFLTNIGPEEMCKIGVGFSIIYYLYIFLVFWNSNTPRPCYNSLRFSFLRRYATRFELNVPASRNARIRNL